MDPKEKEKRETPIIDGDARPDMPVDAGEKSEREVEPDEKVRRKAEEQQPGKKNFETERISDINSLEDYKDAK